MSPKIRLFVTLWMAGMIGVFSFMLVDLTELLATMPVTAGKPIPIDPLLLKLLSVIQPAILLSIAVLVGTMLARKVGLHSPAAEAAASSDNTRGNILAALRPQILPGVTAGVIGSVAVILSWILWKPYLPPEFVARALQLNKLLPLATRLLYGGFTEELLLRWGVMTFFLWAIWRVFQKGEGTPRNRYTVTAIVVSSILFGVGHLPVASALVTKITLSMIVYVVVVNSIFGLIAGTLYWKKGLESAIIAHMTLHVVLVTAQAIGSLG